MTVERGERLARLAYLAAAWAFVACLVIQLFLVGLDLFEVTSEDSGVHREFAYVYGWIVPALVLLAVMGRLPRRRILLTVGLLVLFSLQTYLPLTAETLPQLAAVHGLGAVAVTWLAAHLALASRDVLHDPRTSRGA